MSTPGAWYSPGLSLQAYSMSLLASTVLVVGLVIAGALHVASIGHAVSGVDRRIAVARGFARSDAGSSGSSSPSDRVVEDELDQILGAMERNVGSELVEVRSEPSQPVFTVPKVAAAETMRSVLRELVSERVALRESLSAVRWAVAGPIAAALGFAAIASAMLPGSDGFAVANFQLNTFFILLLAYGWPVLVAWAIVAVAVSRRIEPP